MFYKSQCVHYKIVRSYIAYDVSYRIELLSIPYIATKSYATKSQRLKKPDICSVWPSLRVELSNTCTCTYSHYSLCITGIWFWCVGVSPCNCIHTVGVEYLLVLLYAGCCPRGNESFCVIQYVYLGSLSVLVCLMGGYVGISWYMHMVIGVLVIWSLSSDGARMCWYIDIIHVPWPVYSLQNVLFIGILWDSMILVLRHSCGAWVECLSS